jgi:methylenetetrahydrofolate dehydrogenase (NADP+) / methenyltetrahydrofolate cyclohydrolase
LTGQIIDGLSVATDVKEKVKKAVVDLKNKGIQPSLATILVGDDISSATYIKNKQKTAEEVGINTWDHRLPSTLSQQGLIDLVNMLNKNDKIDGILVQLPLPSNIDESSIIKMINPAKDVDGLTPYNAGLLLNGCAYLKPCTPSGIIEMLDFYNINLMGMDAIIVNRSNLVGKPLSMLLLERDATVTICHSKTKGLKDKLKQADMIITAVGNREIFTLTSEMVKPGSVVIDVGITRYKGKITGDVDYERVREKSSWITPVPGGVGPMTVAMLLKNTVTAASIRRESDNI